MILEAQIAQYLKYFKNNSTLLQIEAKNLIEKYPNSYLICISELLGNVLKEDINYELESISISISRLLIKNSLERIDWIELARIYIDITGLEVMLEESEDQEEDQDDFYGNDA